jgi:hypothetical protein
MEAMKKKERGKEEEIRTRDYRGKPPIYFVKTKVEISSFPSDWTMPYLIFVYKLGIVNIMNMFLFC